MASRRRSWSHEWAWNGVFCVVPTDGDGVQPPSPCILHSDGVLGVCMGTEKSAEYHFAVGGTIGRHRMLR